MTRPTTHKECLNAIPVFYSEAMLADAHHFSPSAMKPRAVMESWRTLDIPLHIQAPEPVSFDDYCLVHDPAYVEGVLTGRIVNGFRNRNADVNDSLAHTNGTMLAVARAALANGQVAIAPCAGFHHAGHAYGGDFCTFNGLMLAARKVILEGRAHRVGILDFDMHHGDGTEDIHHHLKLEDAVRHYSAGQHWQHPEQAQAFLDAIETIVTGFADCDLILYQAGADPHIDDPLGGFLTTAQLMERDRRAFAAAKRLGLPVAWNLAGGYQRDAGGGIGPVLEIHDNTLRACAECFLQGEQHG